MALPTALAARGALLALLALLALTLGCGGGSGLFGGPPEAWDVTLVLFSESPPDCGTTVNESLRGDVLVRGSFLDVVLYFEETAGCEARDWTVSGAYVSATRAQMTDLEGQVVCQLQEAYGLDEFDVEGLFLDFTPEGDSFSGLGTGRTRFGTESCIGVVQLTGWRVRPQAR